MNHLRINGTDFEGMAKNALNYLKHNEKEINDMNVFPVPDGDTGTNMIHTLENGIIQSKSDKDLKTYLKQLSTGMLFGARGNSGVIFSQLFKGLYEDLKREDEANAVKLASSFKNAYKVAYQAVVSPKEGTILTVAREGIDDITDQITKSTTIEEFLGRYIAAMKVSLEKTPDKLQVLKDAGVVDSGAYGYIKVIEGMLEFLNNHIFESSDKFFTAPVKIASNINYSAFNEDTVFEFGYCTEFILQLTNNKNGVKNFNLDNFILELQKLGESIVCFQDNSRVKTHIHTFTPGKVIELAQTYGEFITFKMENMCLQHNSSPHHKKIPYAIIAVGNGNGIKDIFESFPNVYYLDGGPTMNTSSQEFIDLMMKLTADDIIILPDNKNIIRSAYQAVTLSGIKNAHIIETKSIVEGYYAISSALDENDNTQRISVMENAFKNVISVSLAIANRDCVFEKISCKKGDYIALINGEVACSNDNLESLMNQVLAITNKDKDKYAAVIFKGADCSDDMLDTINNSFDQEGIGYDNVDGDQKTYFALIAIM